MKLDRRQVCVVTLSSASELTMLTLGERVMMRKRFSFAVAASGAELFGPNAVQAAHQRTESMKAPAAMIMLKKSGHLMFHKMWHGGPR